MAKCSLAVVILNVSRQFILSQIQPMQVLLET